MEHSELKAELRTLAKRLKGARITWQDKAHDLQSKLDILVNDVRISQNEGIYSEKQALRRIQWLKMYWLKCCIYAGVPSVNVSL